MSNCAIMCPNNLKIIFVSVFGKITCKSTCNPILVGLGDSEFNVSIIMKFYTHFTATLTPIPEHMAYDKPF